MDLSKETTIGEIAAYDYNTASVFEKFGIDFYCKGNISIEKVCQNKNMSPSILIDELTIVLSKAAPLFPDYNSWSIALLTDYIEKKYHAYIKERIPALQNCLHKLCHKQGEIYSELLEINELFEESANGLTVHMKKEELILFFHVRRIGRAKNRNPYPDFTTSDSIENLIELMSQEHIIESERFRKISQLSHNYNPPYKSTNSHKVTFALLKEFEKNLYTHFHLENNILFPKIIRMEKEW